MGYIITILILCAAYILGVVFMKHIANYKIANPIFVALVYIPYVCLCITVYRDVGFHDWNFQNTLPVANVSPFMFSITPLILILPKKLKKHLLLLISLLCVGMFLSTVFGCIYNASIGYKFHFHFLLDFFAHFTLSFFGIYAIRTRQVTFNIRNCLISGSLIFGAATVMMILNVIFDTAFFGLSLNGKHNIYNKVLVDNSYLSALLYYIGLLAVLVMGYFVCKAFAKKNLTISPKAKSNQEDAKSESVEI